MKKEIILVTGGAGYIGSFTVNELIKNGYEVVIYDSLENGHRESINKSAILEIGDIGDSARLDEVLKKYNVTAIIDFAAYLAVGESMSNPVKYLQNNVYNFVNVLDVMVKNGCRYIIKSSTASTYGNPLKDTDFPLKENYQESVLFDKSELLEGQWDNKTVSGDDFFENLINHYHDHFQDRDDLKLDQSEINKLKITTSVYGFTKLLDEIILSKYNKNSDVDFIALRYFNVCGASLDGEYGDDKPQPSNLMTLIIFSLLGKIPSLSVYGNDYPTKDGTGLRDYIHPIDLATGHVAALQYLTKNNKSETFNLGKGIGYTVMEVIEEVEKASGKKVLYKILPRRSGDPALSIADPSKANELLNWKAEHNLTEMSETAWKWHSHYPNGYADKKI